MQENIRTQHEEFEKTVETLARELKEMQVQLIQAQKLARIGPISAEVAHKMGNCITAIFTSAQMLKMNAKGDDLSLITLIDDGAKALRDILQKFASYLQQSMKSESVGRVDLNEVVRSVMTFLKYQLKQENIELVTNITNAPLPIKADRNELEQVITNLVLNAKDAIQLTGRAGKIEVKTMSLDNTLDFTIQDNGRGISKRNLDKIFTPFFTTKEKGKGIGLGLTITQKIVQKYNGSIEVFSKEGEGTTFKVIFPNGT